MSTDMKEHPTYLANHKQLLVQRGNDAFSVTNKIFLQYMQNSHDS